MNQRYTGEYFWNITFSVVFLIIVIFMTTALQAALNQFFMSLNALDVILLGLATFRFIRLLCYDRITAFLRDFFSEHEHGFRQSVYQLLACPWCVSVWAALALIFINLLAPPFGWLLVILLAIAGIGSFLQISANLIGWHAEYQKKKTEK